MNVYFYLYNNLFILILLFYNASTTMAANDKRDNALAIHSTFLKVRWTIFVHLEFSQSDFRLLYLVATDISALPWINIQILHPSSNMANLMWVLVENKNGPGQQLSSARFGHLCSGSTDESRSDSIGSISFCSMPSSLYSTYPVYGLTLDSYHFGDIPDN